MDGIIFCHNFLNRLLNDLLSIIISLLRQKVTHYKIQNIEVKAQNNSEFPFLV